MSQSLIGTWRLVSYEAVGPDGEVTYPLGDDAIGYIIYTPNGYMSVSIMRAGRRSYADGDLLGGTTEEKLTAAETYVSYCGRFEVRENRVIHHIEVAFFPNRVGTSQERFVDLSDGRLSLTTPPMLIEGKQRTGRLVWERT